MIRYRVLFLVSKYEQDENMVSKLARIDTLHNIIRDTSNRALSGAAAQPLRFSAGVSESESCPSYPEHDNANRM